MITVPCRKMSNRIVFSSTRQGTPPWVAALQTLDRPFEVIVRDDGSRECPVWQTPTHACARCVSSETTAAAADDFH